MALKPHSTFSDAAKLWIDKVEVKRRGSTHYTYKRWLECRILPDIGGWRLREFTVGQLDVYLDRLAQEEVIDPTTGERRRRYKPNTLRAIRKAISGPLKLAVKHEVLAANPVRDMDEIEGQGSPPRALTAEERRQLKAWLRGPLLEGSETRAAQEAARRRDLPDLVDFLLGTGVRIGEALAVRWRDVDLDGVPVTNLDGTLRLAPIVSINGNIVRIPGWGLVRHPGKTRKAARTLELPRFTVEVLRARRPDGIEADSELPVFPAMGRDGMVWKDPNNTQRYFREMRDALGWPWLTSHNCCETVITIWSDSDMPDRTTSDNAGHADIVFTKRTYVSRGGGPGAGAAVLDAAYADD